MTGWDVALLAVAGYLALMALTRLMLRRRDAMLGEFREELHRERQRKRDEAKRAARRSKAA
ncbi:MAG: hypothetical protein JW809_17860 [Pirellulales bacterium]|nr:hypothetical protein [Pirellulales bacterium]